MSVVQVAGTVTDANGLSSPFTGTITINTPPVVASVTAVPQAAVAGTMRTITVVASGSAPLTYNLTAPVVISNSTGVFTVPV